MAEVIPTHTHAVVDADRPFVIDPNTMEVTSRDANLKLPQHSKNAEVFTFTLSSSTVEGHDLATCNSVKVHYENVDSKTGKISAGLYTVSDFSVSENGVKLSWVIDDDATRYVGALIFSIHFSCFDEDGALVYNLPTLTYSKITVGSTVWLSDTIEREYPDIVAEFERRLSVMEKAPAVLCSPQVLSPEKKAQARDNIGAADFAFVGDSAAALDAVIEMQEALLNASGTKPDDYGTPYAVEYITQKLTESAKAQARDNIGAVSAADLQQHIDNQNNPHGVTPEQIGARPNTWTPTAAEVGAAPAGYGLGTTAKNIAQDLDTVVENGWYCYNRNTCANTPENSASMLLVENFFDTNYCKQTVTTIFGAIYIRTRNGGTWYPWSCVNPHMILGVEYRTMEEWQGKAVYTKLVDTGSLPSAGTTKSVVYAGGATQAIRTAGALIKSGTGGGDALPFHDIAYGEIAISASASSAKVTVVSWKGTVPALNCAVQVWYVK